jgi:hypothetical protein
MKRLGMKATSGLTAAVMLALAGTAHAQVAAPAAGPPPAFGGEAPPVPRLGPIVFLRTDTPRATLQVQTQLFWQDLCSTPCGVPVDPARLYRVGGRPFVPTEPFTMPRQTGQVVIEARMGSRARNIVGTVLTIVGIPLGVTGGIMLYTGVHEPNDEFGQPTFSKLALTVYGAAFLITGTVLTLVGLPLWATSGTSMTME